MSGWRTSKMDTPRILTKSLIAILNLVEPLNIRPARNPWPGYEASHGSATHLHVSDELFDAIVGPGQTILPLKQNFDSYTRSSRSRDYAIAQVIRDSLNMAARDSSPSPHNFKTASQRFLLIQQRENVSNLQHNICFPNTKCASPVLYEKY